jgi:hypothetical protein
VQIVINTDVEIRRLLYGKEPLIEGRWQGKAGTGVPYDRERFDDTWERGARVDWPLLREYGRAVHVDLLSSVDVLTGEALEWPVDMRRSGLGMWRGSDIYRLHGWNHIRLHGGEIACLKDLQGMRGYKR